MWISSGRRASTPPVHLNSPFMGLDGQLRRKWGSHCTEGLFRIVPNRNVINWNRFMELGVIRKRLLQHPSSSSNSRDLKRRTFTAGLSFRIWIIAQWSLRAIRQRIPLMDRSPIIVRKQPIVRVIGRLEARFIRLAMISSTTRSWGRIWCRPLQDCTLRHLRTWLLRPALLFIFHTEEDWFCNLNLRIVLPAHLNQDFVISLAFFQIKNYFWMNILVLIFFLSVCDFLNCSCCVVFFYNVIVTAPIHSFNFKRFVLFLLFFS